MPAGKCDQRRGIPGEIRYATQPAGLVHPGAFFRSPTGNRILNSPLPGYHAGDAPQAPRA